jgi:hypothetical protein
VVKLQKLQKMLTPHVNDFVEYNSKGRHPPLAVHINQDTGSSNGGYELCTNSKGASMTNDGQNTVGTPRDKD